MDRFWRSPDNFISCNLGWPHGRIIVLLIVKHLSCWASLWTLFRLVIHGFRSPQAKEQTVKFTKIEIASFGPEKDLRSLRISKSSLRKVQNAARSQEMSKRLTFVISFSEAAISDTRLP